MTDNNDIIDKITDIRNLLRRKESRIHMLGICGVGMAGLAFLLKKKGFRVTGCDQSPNHLAGWLRRRGIPVLAGHSEKHIAGADWIIRTSAVAENHPELQAARKAGKKIFQRGLVLAEIASAGNSICVSGTHGKSTTTAMIAQILAKSGLNPSFCIGGEVPAPGGVARPPQCKALGVAGYGTGQAIVLEADESDGTLAWYKPFISVITNIEFDHAEHFKNLAALKKCFAQFIRGTRHKVVYCHDNKEAAKIMAGIQNAVSYGFSSGANLRLKKWRDTPGGLVCSVEHDKKMLGQIRLPVPGRHNALNAAAACAVGLELGIPFAAIAGALDDFQPVARRFERIIATKDLLVISDYAHHPTEIAALLSGASALKRKRWLAVFQPHRYSRTKALGGLFPPAFSGVDELVLCPVYEASEKIIPGGTSWDLYEKFRQYGKVKTVCARSLRQAWDYLKTRAAAGDGILIIGAGDVVKIGQWAKAEIVKDGTQLLPPAVKWRDSLKRLKLKNSPVRFNEPLALKTTLRVGGLADIYIEAGDLTDLALILRWAGKNRVPVRIIGAGSNVLVSDLGVRGIVLRLRGINWRNIRREKGGRIVTGAGVSLQKLVSWTAQQGLAGAEFLARIPGTVGGALRMNAGAWGREFSDIVRWVRVMEPNGKVRRMNRARLGFAYRCCKGIKNRIILEAALTLYNGKTDTIRGEMRQIMERRRWMSSMRSAGSVFKNPEKDFAGRLVENLGLKGKRIGLAKISEQHANIIASENGAKASDVLALVEIAHYLAKMKYGLDLEREIEYLE